VLNFTRARTPQKAEKQKKPKNRGKNSKNCQNSGIKLGNLAKPDTKWTKTWQKSQKTVNKNWKIHKKQQKNVENRRKMSKKSPIVSKIRENAIMAVRWTKKALKLTLKHKPPGRYREPTNYGTFQTKSSYISALWAPWARRLYQRNVEPYHSSCTDPCM